MAACIAETVVSRSATTVEIDTFMTELSSTITNWAAPRMIKGPQRFIVASGRVQVESRSPEPPGRRRPILSPPSGEQQAPHLPSKGDLLAVPAPDRQRGVQRAHLAGVPAPCRARPAGPGCGRQDHALPDGAHRARDRGP